MNNIWIIGKRQFLSYVNGPIAYIVLIAVLILFGALHWLWFFPQNRASTRLMFWLFSFFAYIAVPALTMGVIAEEKRTGTFELLVTMPVTEAQIIIGKYLGVSALYVVLVALTFTYPITIGMLGDLDWGPVFSGYLAVLLQGSALLAFGIMVSAMTSSQIVAFFITLFFSVLVFLADMLSQYKDQFALEGISGGLIRFVTEELSFSSHLADMQRGVIPFADVIFFLTIVAISLLVAFRAVESRRWS